jgi:hypothetical protein
MSVLLSNIQARLVSLQYLGWEDLGAHSYLTDNTERTVKMLSGEKP